MAVGARLEDERGGGPRRGVGGRGRRSLKRRAEGGAQVAGRAGHTSDAERGHAARVGSPVTGRHAVEDGGTAGDEPLEAGDPAARVHERVGRGDQVTHAVCEAEDAHARLLAEAPLEALARLVVAPGDADHGRHPDLEGAAHRPLEVADPPTPAGHQHDAADLGQPERAPGLACGPGLEVRGRHERAHLPRAARARELLDVPVRAVVHDEMEVDAGMGPELEARQVEDRGADRRAQPAAPAQATEDRVDARVGGHDDIGRVRLDQAEEPLGADPVEEGLSAPPHRREPHQERVDDAEDPGHPAELEPGAVADHPLEERTERGEAVGDHDVSPRMLVGQPGGQGPSGRVMAFPEVGGQDEDPSWRGDRGLDDGLSVRVGTTPARHPRLSRERAPPVRPEPIEFVRRQSCREGGARVRSRPDARAGAT